MQIYSTAPSTSVANGEFAAVGYMAGCVGSKCSGFTSGGSNQEKIYTDGINGATYYLVLRENVTPGQEHRIEIRGSAGDWNIYRNGYYVGDSGQAMSRGYGAHGGETEAGPTSQSTTKEQQYMFFLERSQVGNANWYATNQVNEYEPHSTCTLTHVYTDFVGWYLEGNGSC